MLTGRLPVHTLDGHTLDGQTVDGQTVDGQTLATSNDMFVGAGRCVQACWCRILHYAAHNQHAERCVS